MYKWVIDIIFKYSGKELRVYYSGDENNSSAVAEMLLDHSHNSNFKGFSNANGTKNIFINVNEIASFTIYCR